MEKLESYGSGVIWCSMHPQSLTLAQYAECLKYVEIGPKVSFLSEDTFVNVFPSHSCPGQYAFHYRFSMQANFKCKTIYATY